MVVVGLCTAEESCSGVPLSVDDDFIIGSPKKTHTNIIFKACKGLTPTVFIVFYLIKLQLGVVSALPQGALWP